MLQWILAFPWLLCFYRKVNFKDTVSRRFKERRMFVNRPVICNPLTSANRRVRFAWYRDYRIWITDQWTTVPFTDKSGFSLTTDSQSTFKWREASIRYLPSNVGEIDHFGSGSLMSWTGIILHGCTILHVLALWLVWVIVVESYSPMFTFQGFI